MIQSKNLVHRLGKLMYSNWMDILDNMPMGVYFTDTQRKIIYWNRSAEKITGYAAEEVIGYHCQDNILVHVDQTGEILCKGMCPLAKTMLDGVSRDAEVFLSHKRGHRKTVRVYTIPLKDKNGKVIGGAEIFSDTSIIAAMESKTKALKALAFFDQLTKLPNREHIKYKLHGSIAKLKRYGIPFGILFLDIDNFKGFNDNYGHEVGDQVLQTIAATLLSTCRPFDLFGRWGGEEFIGIINNVDMNSLNSIGNRYRRLIEKSYVTINDEKISVTVSIGATLADPEDTIDTLVGRADQLMYKSKQGGRNRLTSGMRI